MIIYVHCSSNKLVGMDKTLLSLALILLCFLITLASCSNGDRSPFYQKCVKGCSKSNCTEDGAHFTPEASAEQDFWSKALLWSCLDECRYICMWSTVEAFRERNYETPKFHGKWPFQRVFGVQEPIAAFSSVLNLLAHIYMYFEMSQQFPIKEVPHVLLWHLFTLVCVNAWTWSAIFHTRDKPFTEFMDYSCALSMVMGLLVAAIVRVFHKRRKLTAMILLVLLVFFITHVQYLYTGRIDYEYNITVNVAFGVLGSIIWILWAAVQYIAGHVYVWRVVAFTLWSGVLLSLELLDFEPLYDMWDAHALWHFNTAPLPLVFYRFVIDDLKQMQNDKLPIFKSNLKTKTTKHS